MDIKLSPKKEKKVTDIVHNSANTSAVEAKRILTTTPEQAQVNSYFAQLVENWEEIKATLYQRSEELHADKNLIIIQENAELLKQIVNFFKSKGGEVSITPSLSYETLNVSVEIKFTKELTFNRSEIQFFNNIIKDTQSFEIDASPSSAKTQIRFAFSNLGEYVLPIQKGR